MLLAAGCGGDNKPANSFTAKFQQYQSDPNAEAAARNLSALALQQKEKADTAGGERSLEAASKRAGELKAGDGRATAFNAIASAQGQFGLRTDCRKSLKEVQESIDKMSNDEARAKALARMALSFESYLDDANQSKHYFSEAEKAAKKAGDAPAQARSLLEISRYLSFSKNAEQKPAAVRLITEAKGIATSIQEDRARIDALAEIVVTLEKGGNKAEATVSLEEATKAAKAITAPASRAHAFIDLAERTREIGRRDESVKLFDEALAASKEVPDPSLKSEVENRLDRSRKG